MLHEAHTGPLGTLNYTPRGRYYGSITTSGFYPVIVSELWHWTGDRELVGSLIDPMLRSLAWLDRYGDLDQDGFYEYQTHSIQGSPHQAWKDSRDGIVDKAGQFVEPPIATCEEQGFAYIAKLLASELLWRFDRKEDARQLYRQAGELKKRFNQAFWMPEEGFYAMGLDARKQQIQAVGSNPGHLLATGIAAEEHVPQTAERFFRLDLFSGWGVRTLSAENPAYNPFSYHRGSIWPVEHGTFALGFMRYGLHDAVERICLSQFMAAALFEHYRLPEVFAGHPLDEDHPFPALYAQTNAPQAWSASSLFTLVQAMLGLYPYAPLNLLLVDPHLPAWLPDITLEGLRVGASRATIRFYRTEDGTSDYRVLEVEGTLHVIRQPSPWSITAGFGERLSDFFTSLLPGK
jgi:glycogen debranching enzyme